MKPPLLIIITGDSGAGKTTLAHRLADELRLPLIYRDGLKETLFESLGWSDVAWSQKLGGVSYDLLYHVLEQLLRAGVSAIVESNFDPAFATQRFRILQERNGFTAIQIKCVAAQEVLRRRIRQRAATGDRHPGHVEHLREQELIPSPSAPIEYIDIDGARLELDTSDFERIDYRALLAAIQHAGREG